MESSSWQTRVFDVIQLRRLQRGSKDLSGLTDDEHLRGDIPDVTSLRGDFVYNIEEYDGSKL
jgi:hypothetical protein